MEQFPQLFGRYEILDLLATGGMAKVYRARYATSSEAPNRILAIKKMLPTFSSKSEFRETFEREVSITLGLTHPNIIQVYDFGRANDEYFIAMEYVPGKSLKAILAKGHQAGMKMPYPLASLLIIGVSEALQYAHTYRNPMTGEHLSIVHRDISPQNVMVSLTGQVKLFDFGVSLIGQMTNVDEKGTVFGKPGYMSPEQLTSKTIDNRSDLFSLGIVFWEVLTGRRLFAGQTDRETAEKVLRGNPPPPSKYNPELPKEIDDIVLKCLSRDVLRRYQTASELKQDLKKHVLAKHPTIDSDALGAWMLDLVGDEAEADGKRLLDLLAKNQLALTQDLDEIYTKSIRSPAFKQKQAVKRDRETQQTMHVKAVAAEEQETITVATGSSKLKVEPVEVTPPAESLKVAKQLEGSFAPVARAPRPEPMSVILQRHEPQPGAGFRRVTAIAACLVALLLSWQNGWLNDDHPRKPAAVNGSAPAESSTGPSATDQTPAPSTAASNMAPLFQGPVAIDDPSDNMGTLVVKANVDNVRVLVNGKEVPMMGQRVPVPLNERLELHFLSPGRREIKMAVTLKERAPKEVSLKFQQKEPAPGGY